MASRMRNPNTLTHTFEAFVVLEKELLGLETQIPKRKPDVVQTKFIFPILQLSQNLEVTNSNLGKNETCHHYNNNNNINENNAQSPPNVQPKPTTAIASETILNEEQFFAFPISINNEKSREGQMTRHKCHNNHKNGSLRRSRSIGSQIEHFTYVRLDKDHKWIFGYCRQQYSESPDDGARKSTCYIFLSYIPYAENVFYRALNQCSSILQEGSENQNPSCEDFLYNLYNTKVGCLNSDINFITTINHEKELTKFPLSFPPQYGTSLPKTLDNRPLSELYNSLTSNSLILLFASLLAERKVIITSSRLSRLSSIVLACNIILYPFHWQHLFIPILPEDLTDCLEAPTPFIIGVPSCTFDFLADRTRILGDVVHVDADTDSITSPFPEDLNAIPSNIMTFLKKNLGKSDFTGDNFARTFLRVFIKLVGHYENGFVSNGERMKFDVDRFLKTTKSTRRYYLKTKIIHLQMFEQFINERLEYGLGFMSYDIFQQEILNRQKPLVGICRRKKKLSTHYTNGAFLPFAEDKYGTFSLRHPSPCSNRNISSGQSRNENPPHQTSTLLRFGSSKLPQNHGRLYHSAPPEDPSFSKSWSNIVSDIRSSFRRKYENTNQSQTQNSDYQSNSNKIPVKEKTDVKIPIQDSNADSPSLIDLEADIDRNNRPVSWNANLFDEFSTNPTELPTSINGNNVNDKTMELLKQYGLDKFYQ